MPRPAKIYLDMDGVLALMVEASILRHELPTDFVWPAGEYDCSKATGLTTQAYWDKLDDHEFWAYEIPPSPAAVTLIRVSMDLAGIDRVRILSRPTHSPFSASGKIEWIRTHFPALSRRYCLAVDKTDLNPNGDVLVDDSETNCRSWEEAGGRAILWPCRQNRRFLDRPADAIAELRALFSRPD